MQNKRMKILFITMGKVEPASRFRVLAYLPYLKQQDLEFTVYPLHLGRRAFSVSRPKLFWALLLIFRKIRSIFHVRGYDLVFLQRPVIKYFSPGVEKIMKYLNPNLVFDFDDAIWLNYAAAHNPVDASLRLAKLVIAGNSYLADYAKKFNSQVLIIPTPIDTRQYKFPIAQEKTELILGWVGTAQNLKYLYALKDIFFKSVAQKYPQAKLQVICDQEPKFALGMHTEFIPWDKQTEIARIANFSVGLMPLTDDAWTKGKCAFKALQYLSLGIPVLASAVGMNKEVIQSGVNGWLIAQPEDWLKYFTVLMEMSPEQKGELCLQARRTITTKYALEKIQESWLKALLEAAK